MCRTPLLATMSLSSISAWPLIRNRWLFLPADGSSSIVSIGFSVPLDGSFLPTMAYSNSSFSFSMLYVDVLTPLTAASEQNVMSRMWFFRMF
uniref:Putative secreted peptide n=1 Tax=Anopheles braziliensis TaxID=58242 RepID=A0A2M3ZN60_9DIPT